MGRRITNGLTGNIGSSISSLAVVDNSIITVVQNENLVLDPNGTGAISTDAPLVITNSTASTSSSTGAVRVTGGISSTTNIYAGATIAGSNFSNNDGDYLTIPSGTTAQRPGSPQEGWIRFNTDLGVMEAYNGTSWRPMEFKDVDVTGNRTTNSFETNWVNTASTAITVTLPSSPAKGDRVRFFDVANTFDTRALTVARNGQRIMGDNTSNLTVNTEGAAFELVYYNSTYGWRIFTV